MHTRLSVNLNKVALVRNTRPLGIPSMVRAAQLCVAAGVHGITLHPRPDARHVRSQDVYEMATLLKDHPQVEYNLEGNPFENLMDFVRTLRPHQCTFVPDSQAQATSDHGWHFPQDLARLTPLVREAQSLGVRVSLFMDADDPAAMAAARTTGADRVELYTEPWARDFATPRQADTLSRYIACAAQAMACGMAVNAGHDLNLHNLPPLIQAIPQLAEVSIGHAFIADALEMGYTGATRAYLLACRQPETT